MSSSTTTRKAGRRQQTNAKRVAARKASKTAATKAPATEKKVPGVSDRPREPESSPESAELPAFSPTELQSLLKDNFENKTEAGPYFGPC
jgi:hypothetical protein